MYYKWIATIISIAVIYCIYVPLTLHFLRTFWRYKSKVVIAKRHPSIVAAFSLCCIAYLAISRPVSLVVAVMLNTKQKCFSENCDYNLVVDLDIYATSFLHSFTLLPMPLLLFTKFWLIFWDIKRIQYSFNFEWKTLINPYFYLMNCQTTTTISKSLSRTTTISNLPTKDNVNCNVSPKHIIQQQKFWLTYKSTFGDEKYMIKLTAIIWLICSTISATCWIVIDGLLSYERIASIFDFTVCFAALGGVWVLTVQTPKMMDKLHIRDEIAYSAACVLWPLIFNLIAFILVSNSFWRVIITTHIISFSLFIISTFQLKFVFIRCKHLIHDTKNLNDSQIQSMVRSLSNSKSKCKSQLESSKKGSNSDSESNSTSSDSASRSLQAQGENNHTSDSLSISATAVERLEKMRMVSQEISLMSEKNKHVIDSIDWTQNKQDQNDTKNPNVKLTNVLPNATDDQNVTIKKTTSLAKVLKNEQNLERLMHHLSLEFSMEIILGFIEFTQFLDLLSTKLSIIQNDDQASTGIIEQNIQINLVELNEKILSNPDYTAFHSFLDKILFDEKDVDISRIKIFEFPDTVPTSFILFNNLYNIANVTNNDMLPESTTDANPFGVINRPMLVLQNNNDFDDNEKQMIMLYESMSLLLLQLSSFYSIGYELYTKYMKRGSEFELSICSDLKDRFYEIFEEFNFLKFINNFSQQPSSTSTSTSSDFNFEMNVKMRNKTERMKYQFEIAIQNDMQHYISPSDDNNNYNTAMQPSHKDNVTFLFNPQKGIQSKRDDLEPDPFIPLSCTTSQLQNNDVVTQLAILNQSQPGNDKGDDGDLESFAPSSTLISLRDSDTGQSTNESEFGSVSSNELRRQKTENLLIEKIRIHDLSWLLFKEKFNHDNEMVERIHNQLKNNVFAFLLLISKLFRKTNDELQSLLLFSLDRLLTSKANNNNETVFD